MANPWLNVSPEDYEGHMDSPEVDQLSFLSEVFARALTAAPRTIALLGCATGNGLEHLHGRDIDRVTAVDVHSGYLQRARQRHEAHIANLELLEADLETDALDESAYELVFCALVLEHVEPAPVIANAARALAPGGVFVVVVQLASDSAQPAAETRYESIRHIGAAMQLRTPEEVAAWCEAAGLSCCGRRRETLTTGKRFAILQFERSVEGEEEIQRQT